MAKPARGRRRTRFSFFLRLPLLPLAPRGSSSRSRPCSRSTEVVQGIRPDVVRSVLAERANLPDEFYQKLLPKIIEAYSHTTRIVLGKDVTDDLEAMSLWSFITKVSDMEIDDFVEAFVCLLQPLGDFCNHIFVMVVNLPKGFASLTKVVATTSRTDSLKAEDIAADGDKDGGKCSIEYHEEDHPEEGPVSWLRPVAFPSS